MKIKITGIEIEVEVINEDTSEKAYTLNTVNVIEHVNGTMVAIFSWTDNDEGSKLAEDYFEAIIKQNGFVGDEEELGYALKEGWWENGDGYQAFIAHSTIPTGSLNVTT